jgi:transposase
VVRHWQRHEKQSLFSALALSPKRRRVQLLWDMQRPAWRTWDLVPLVRRLRRQVGRKLLLIWDRLPGHRSAAKFLEGEQIQIAYLPAYAPELNPVEWVWSQAKYAKLANWVPDDTDELEERYHDTLADFNQEQPLLRSFFQGAELSLE